ncbi:MAG: MBL fold metallo-hydrolase [Pseudomonadota bacterium]
MAGNRIVLLGVKGGPAVRPDSPLPTASLLQLAGRNIVVDCGIGVTRSLVETGVTLLEIDAIFITHLHSDHLLELGPLIYTAWTTGLKRPIQVFGPAGTKAYWQAFLTSMSFDHAIRIEDEGRIPLDQMVSVSEFDEGVIPALDGIGVAALRVRHPPVTDTFALRFDAAGRSVVFSADTCYFEPLAHFARGADVLVHEAMLTEGIDALVTRTNGGARLRNHLLASHTPASDVGRIATQAGIGHLVLNHLVPIDDPAFTSDHWLAEATRHWTGKTTVGQDGLSIPLG